MYGVIYCLISPSRKAYIGQTINLKKRFRSYVRGNCPSQPKLHTALLKYGFKNFEFYLLERCSTKEELDLLEQHYIDFFQSVDFGYNCVPGGSGVGSGSQHPMYGKTHTEEWRKNHSNAMSGNKHPQFGKKGKLSPNFGKIRTPEMKKKYSQCQMGEKNPSFGKTGDKSHNYGIKRSKETLQKMSETQKNNKRKIMCIENQIVYESQHEAARILGVPTGNIAQQAKGLRKFVGDKSGNKYTFKYI